VQVKLKNRSDWSPGWSLKCAAV